MRVLLIQPPLEDFYTTPIRLYPLGLLYTAAVLKKIGCQVQVLDCLTPLRKRRRPIPSEFSYLKSFLADNPLLFKNYYRFGISTEKILTTIDDFKPDMIGIASQFTAYYKTVERLSAVIKNHVKIPIFVGGNHATIFKAEILKTTTHIDFVLQGLAEEAVPSFLSSQKKFRSIPESFDWKTLCPSHELIASGAYKIGKKNYMSIIASRGCPYHCEFCSAQTMFGRRIEYRRLESVLQEMCWNYIHKGVRLFNFEDDNLSFDNAWFCSFLNAVIKNPLLKNIELTAMNGLCYPTLKEEMLKLMRRAGFSRMNLSFVTQDKTLQQQYQRPRHSQDFERLIVQAKQLGFLVTVYIIIGLPQQSFAEIKRTVDYLLNLGVLVGPSVFYIPPGSKLFKRLDLPEAILSNWDLYRSSAFAVETPLLSRSDLVALFSYVRSRNLENKDFNKSLRFKKETV